MTDDWIRERVGDAERAKAQRDAEEERNRRESDEYKELAPDYWRGICQTVRGMLDEYNAVQSTLGSLTYDVWRDEGLPLSREFLTIRRENERPEDPRVDIQFDVLKREIDSGTEHYTVKVGTRGLYAANRAGAFCDNDSIVKAALSRLFRRLAS